MSNDLNKVQIIGRIGKDIEISNHSGKDVTTLSVVTNKSWKDKNGNKQEKAEWHNVVLWEGLATVAGKYLDKGSQVYIEGELQTRKWQDKQGNDRYTTEILGKNLQMLGSKSGSQQATSAQPANEYDQSQTPF